MRLAVIMKTAIALCGVFLSAAAAAEKLSDDPFATPIEATQGIVAVDFVEFARIPDADGGEAPRLMHMVTETGTKRLFVSAMRGAIYAVSYDGKKVSPYLDINAANWAFPVQFAFSERGLQSIAFHPQFAERGKPGYGKFYTYVDTTNTQPTPDFVPANKQRSHDTVLLEWTTKTPGADAYDGGAPKEVFRTAHPFPNHNGGQIAFNPLAKSGSEDYGLLYVGFADGGAGGDPMNNAQNLATPFGKILRLDPLGTNSKNGHYGIPASNPFVSDGKDDTLGEIYAYGVRNPQRFNWDPKDGRMLVADIGQNLVEEISPVTKGANLGWVKWEASYRFLNRQVDLDSARGDAGLTWPIVEYDHKDPLLQRVVAITGVTVYRSKEIKQLTDLLIFGDNPSGEIFYVNADKASGGQADIRRILLNDGGKQKKLLELINEKLSAAGKPAASRVDLRFGFGPSGQIFVMNKRDGIIRLIVPDGSKKTSVS
jgi:glucose/arabinose dehydrogenase